MKSSHFRFTALIGTALVLGACARDSADPVVQAKTSQQVAVATLGEPQALRVPRQFAGLVVPRQNVDIGFEVAGKIDRISVDEGYRVERGAVLAELDREVLLTERERLEAQLEDNAAQLVLNTANRARTDDLAERGFASQQRRDEQEAERASLQAQARALRASLATNAERLAQSTLIAPFAGTVARRFLDEGAVVAPGTPALQLIEDGTLEARIGVPTRLIAAIEAGQTLALIVGDQRTLATVLTVGNDVSRSTLTVPVRIAVPPTLRAIAGDQAYVEIDEDLEQDGYWVPLAAVTDGLRGLWTVYALDASGEHAAVEARDVHILYADGERAFVAGALTTGDRLVQSGLHRLVPGQRVTPIDPGPSDAG